jgi:hypothetical protein
MAQCFSVVGATARAQDARLKRAGGSLCVVYSVIRRAAVTAMMMYIAISRNSMILVFLFSFSIYMTIIMSKCRIRFDFERP